MNLAMRRRLGHMRPWRRKGRRAGGRQCMTAARTDGYTSASATFITSLHRGGAAQTGRV